MVAVAADHALGAVDIGLLPFGRAGEVEHHSLVAGHPSAHLRAVALKVGLVHDVQAVLVAKVEPARVVGIMGRAHAVHVHLLHQLNVAQKRFHRRHMTQLGMRVVTVHALELDGHAVHKQLAIADLHLFKADHHARGLDNLAAGKHVHRQRVAVRGLRRPLLHGGHAHFVFHGRFRVRAAGMHRLFAVIEREGELRALGRRNVRADGQKAVLIAFVQRRVGAQVANVGLGHAQQIHVAENAAQAPEVLILQIRRVRPLVHLNGHKVLALVHEIRDLEFGGHMADLAEAHLRAVHIHIERAVHAVKVQIHPSILPRGGQMEPAAIQTHRVVVRHKGRVERDGIDHVRILRDVVAAHLPVAGHVQRVPVLHAEAHGLEAVRTNTLVGIIKVPAAVQRFIIRAECALRLLRLRLGGVGKQRNARRLAADLRDFRVLPVTVSVHANFPPIMA